MMQLCMCAAIAEAGAVAAVVWQSGCVANTIQEQSLLQVVRLSSWHSVSVCIHPFRRFPSAGVTDSSSVEQPVHAPALAVSANLMQAFVCSLDDGILREPREPSSIVYPIESFIQYGYLRRCGQAGRMGNLIGNQTTTTGKVTRHAVNLTIRRKFIILQGSDPYVTIYECVF